jgi:hypothetical protein
MKPEYNTSETEIRILQEEITKREVVKEKEETRRGDNYLFRTAWITVSTGTTLIVVALLAYETANAYIELKKAMVNVTNCPVCPPPTPCPQEAVPVKN